MKALIILAGLVVSTAGFAEEPCCGEKSMTNTQTVNVSLEQKAPEVKVSQNV